MTAGSRSVPADAASVDLPFAMSATAAARAAVSSALPADTARPVVEVAHLVVSELVANAVDHGRPTAGGGVELAWWYPSVDVLRISVRDGGDVEELLPRLPSPEAARGRGLHLVDHLSLTWQWCIDDGVRVTADIALA